MRASKQDRKPHRGNELRGVGRCRNRFQAVRCAAVKPVLKLHKGKHVARLTQLMDVIKSEVLQSMIWPAMIISADIGLSLAVTVAVNIEMVPVRDQGLCVGFGTKRTQPDRLRPSCVLRDQ